MRIYPKFPLRLAFVKIIAVLGLEALGAGTLQGCQVAVFICLEQFCQSISVGFNRNYFYLQRLERTASTLEVFERLQLRREEKS